MNKEQFMEWYGDLAASPRLKTYMGTTLTLPEIQAQVKRMILNYGLTQEEIQFYAHFLALTEAPRDIEHRYKGEHCTRVYLSQKDFLELLHQKPRGLGGCKIPRVESEQTCVIVGSHIDPRVADWLREQGVQLEFVWENEIGRKD